jgi:DNA repair protein RecO (recombination protein O)
MLLRGKGIVLSFVPYSETSVVVKIFTEEFGVLSFLVNGARKPRAAISMAHLQPGNVLDLVMYYKESSGLQRLKEVRCQPVLHGIQTSVSKMTVVQFMMEIVSSTLKEGFVGEGLFEFCEKAILHLNETNESIALLPSHFLILFAETLGMEPDTVMEVHESDWQDDFRFRNPQVEELYSELKRTDLVRTKTQAVPKALRTALIEDLLQFYRMNILASKSVHSYRVLKEVLA